VLKQLRLVFPRTIEHFSTRWKANKWYNSHVWRFGLTRYDEYREKDSLGSLRFNIRESALAAYFYIPALITEDVELGPTFNRWFQVGKVDEMVSDAEDWKLKQKGYFSVEDLQAENIYYFMVSDCFTTQ
jgi:hypothetical protein